MWIFQDLWGLNFKMKNNFSSRISPLHTAAVFLHFPVLNYCSVWLEVTTSLIWSWCTNVFLFYSSFVTRIYYAKIWEISLMFLKLFCGWKEKTFQNFRILKFMSLLVHWAHCPARPIQMNGRINRSAELDGMLREDTQPFESAVL